MFKKLIILMSILCTVSCPGHVINTSFLLNDYKKIYKHSVCDSEKPFPQMIVLPYFKNATQIVSDCGIYPKHETVLGLMIFYEHWVKTFGDSNHKVKDALEKIMITWGLEKRIMKRAYGLDGRKIKNATIIGLTQSASIIWVWRGKDFKMSKSSLTHELVHVALRALNGHGDFDHEGSIREGWTTQHTELIIDVKRALQAFGL